MVWDRRGHLQATGNENLDDALTCSMSCPFTDDIKYHHKL